MGRDRVTHVFSGHKMPTRRPVCIRVNVPLPSIASRLRASAAPVWSRRLCFRRYANNLWRGLRGPSGPHSDVDGRQVSVLVNNAGITRDTLVLRMKVPHARRRSCAAPSCRQQVHAKPAEARDPALAPPC